MADQQVVKRGAEDGTPVERADAGSSLIEQIIAMVVITTVLLGLLSTLGATAKGLTTGRQRTIAVSLAKQAVETLQADYKNLATGSGATADPRLDPAQTGMPRTFGGEPLFPAVIAPAEIPVLNPDRSYRSNVPAVSTTFTLKTFVTTVAPTSGDGYRRITVFVEWPSSPPLPPHVLKFSSLAYDLHLETFPASSGSAETTGGLITLSGCLAGETIDDVHFALPGVRADTNASTLRTAIGAAAGATSHLETHPRTDASLPCAPGVGTDIRNVRDCPLDNVDSYTDNDASSTTPNYAEQTADTPVNCPLSTPTGDVMVTSPAETLTSNAKTDSCSGTWCTTDRVPKASATANTATANTRQSATLATFNSSGLIGSFWSSVDVWSLSATVDHDTTVTGVDTGTVSASATLTAPALTMLTLAGAPDGFAGAVIVSAFTAQASAAAGETIVAPSVSSGATVSVWNGSGYSAQPWVPGTDVTTPSSSVVIGDRSVSFTAHLQSEQSTTAVSGTAPRTDALAVQPSVLKVTVDVTISRSTPTPTTTDTFTIVADYGRVSARSTWLVKAP